MDIKLKDKRQGIKIMDTDMESFEVKNVFYQWVLY